MLSAGHAAMSIEAQNIAAVASAKRRVKKRKEGFMGKVIVDMSMSLDGFIAGQNNGVARPLGDGRGVARRIQFVRYHTFLLAPVRDIIDSVA